MTDIVERLRDFGPAWSVEKYGRVVPYEICAAAADEIERLRALAEDEVLRRARQAIVDALDDIDAAADNYENKEKALRALYIRCKALRDILERAAELK